MTCVVGILNGSEAVFGSDSAATADDSTISQDITDDGKMFENGNMLFGYCGSGRFGQLLEYALVIPKRKRSQTPLKYMTTTFMDAVRACLKAGGAAGKGKITSPDGTDEVEGEERGGDFMVAFEGNLFVVYSDFWVSQPRLPFAAIGCGAPIAHGALHALYQESPSMPVLKRAKRALEASARYSAGVRPPFRYRRLAFHKPPQSK